jgi:hypothetical protein
VKITEQEVRYVADLANLKLTDREIGRLSKDLDDILGHMDTLTKLTRPTSSPWRKYCMRPQRPPRFVRIVNAPRWTMPLHYKMLHWQAQVITRFRG